MKSLPLALAAVIMALAAPTSASTQATRRLRGLQSVGDLEGSMPSIVMEAAPGPEAMAEDLAGQVATAVDEGKAAVQSGEVPETPDLDLPDEGMWDELIDMATDTFGDEFLPTDADSPSVEELTVLLEALVVEWGLAPP